MAAFIDTDLEEAEEKAKEAILMNPEIFAAHLLLSEIYWAQGDKDRATSALFNGAHTRYRDPEVWTHVGELILEREIEDDPQRRIKAALYCFTRVVSLQPQNDGARLKRAMLSREAGQPNVAVKDFARMLKKLPQDTALLRNAAGSYLELGKSAEAIPFYDDAILKFQLQEVPNAPFDWSDANIYAELFIDSGLFSEGHSKVKSVCRWLLGRAEESFWDDYDDDREFDRDHELRRFDLDEFDPCRFPLSAYGEDLPLELRIKIGILRLRQEGGYVDEALGHFDFLEPDAPAAETKVFDYADLFKDAADALRLTEHFQEALQFYEPIQQVKGLPAGFCFEGMATCYRSLGMLDQAEQCYRALAEANPNERAILKELVQMLGDAGLADRAGPYVKELASKRRKYRPRRTAYELEDDETDDDEESDEPYEVRWDDVVVADIPFQSVENGDESYIMPTGNQRRGMKDSDFAFAVRGEAETTGMGRPRVAKPPKRTKASKRSRMGASSKRKRPLEPPLKNLATSFSVLDQLKQRSKMGNAAAKGEWVDIASSLIERFKEETALFPPAGYRTRPFYGFSAKALAHAKKPKREQDPSSIHPESIPVTYAGVHFNDWLDVYLSYAVVLAERGNLTDAYAVAKSATACNVWYHSPDAMFAIHMTWALCALLAGDDQTLCGLTRWFMLRYQFATDAYRLFAALHLLLPPPHLWYTGNAVQKFIMRQIKAVDFSLIGLDRGEELFHERPAINKDKDGKPILAEEQDIALLLLYGQMLMTSGSHTNALFFFFRCLAIDPDHVLVNLHTGIAYLHYAMGRQVENRHRAVLQGLHFLFKYLERREQSDEPSERQEAVFNVGRAFHLLGLAHLALPYYEQALELKEEEKKEKKSKFSECSGESALREKDIEMQDAINEDGDGEGAQGVRDLTKARENTQEANIRPDVMALDIANHGQTVQEQHDAAEQHSDHAQQEAESEEEGFEVDFTMEAAYALRCMYLDSKNMEMAQEITEKWLVI